VRVALSPCISQDTRPENGMVEWAAARGAGLLAYGVLAGGFLTDAYLGVRAEDVKVDTYR
jgi:aryl-alcohol dehydrogenase-like predicted oxidoreductase